MLNFHCFKASSFFSQFAAHLYYLAVQALIVLRCGLFQIVLYILSRGTNGGGAWTTEGCSLKNLTEEQITCTCTHLTNFAVLMSTSKTVSNKKTE